MSIILEACRRVVTSIRRVCLSPLPGISRRLCSLKFLVKSLALVVLRLIKELQLAQREERMGWSDEEFDEVRNRKSLQNQRTSSGND